jgi:2-polyprenyl-3-methyl-5-hydroxy-6-metoxy-1,4-benzoquinol methylase
MTSTISQTKKSCPVCSSHIQLVGKASYYTKDARFKTDMYACESCDIYVRDVDSASMEEHYYAATYVQVDNERRFYDQRINFFRHIVSLITNHASEINHSNVENLNIADFGSSYGHLLEAAAAAGIKSVGIELNKDLITYCTQKGMVVVNTLDELTEPVDVFSLIDSLYCVPNPREILSQMRDRLNPNGFIIARLTNRNLYAKVRNVGAKEKDFSILGDATISYSIKGAKRLFEQSGLEIAKVIPEIGNHKQSLGFRRNLLYSGTALLSTITGNRIVITPGIIVIARPKR